MPVFDKHRFGITVLDRKMTRVLEAYEFRVADFNQARSFNALWDRLLDKAVTEELAASNIWIEAHFPSEMRDFDHLMETFSFTDIQRPKDVYEALDKLGYDRRKRRFIRDWKTLLAD